MGLNVPKFIVLTTLVATSAEPALTQMRISPYARLRAIGIRDARWTSGFWAQRFALARDVTMPEMWRTLQIHGNGASFINLRIAAGLTQGEFKGNNWSDGDVYKWLEGASFIYALARDRQLEALLDEVVATIAKAQEPDGYISTNITLAKKQRWEEPRNHEMYNLGHLMAAACAHYRATGKTTLLQVARKAADYLCGLAKTEPQRLARFGAPSYLLGIIELYRTTNEPRYLELARFFVDTRGTIPGGTDHFQMRVPLRKETEAVGHAVHATYLYAAAADLVAEKGDEELRQALERIWRDVTERKIYITGAVGALARGVSQRGDFVVEAFGAPYELPNRAGYNETCANIGNALWNWRMFALTSDVKYADLMELVLYNSVLSGIGISGKDFFYTNVHRRYADQSSFMHNETLLRWRNTVEKPAAGSYCCPPNILRTLAALHMLAYSLSKDGVWVNLYGGSVLRTKLPDGTPLELTQQTEYPWEGHVQLRVESAGAFTLNLRVPGWAEGATVRVNGQPGPAARAGSYVSLSRTWKPGDSVELTLPLHPRLVEAHPKAEELRNQVAVMRGPLVYALESPDLPPGVRISEVFLPAQIKLTPHHEGELLGGVTVLEGEAVRIPEGDWTGLLYRTLLRPTPEKIRLRLIPYYAWANRGVSYMTVWLPVLR